MLKKNCFRIDLRESKFLRVSTANNSLACKYTERLVLQYLTTEIIIIVLLLLYTTASTPVTALIVQVTSSSSLQISWGPPEMLNGILTYYELTITSEADGSLQTRRIQHNQSTEVNVTGLGKTN